MSPKSFPLSPPVNTRPDARPCRFLLGFSVHGASPTRFGLANMRCEKKKTRVNPTFVLDTYRQQPKKQRTHSPLREKTLSMPLPSSSSRSCACHDSLPPPPLFLGGARHGSFAAAAAAPPPAAAGAVHTFGRPTSILARRENNHQADPKYNNCVIGMME